MKQQRPAQHSPQAHLGTFAGVFTPSILTILGIILFLRLGYVVGSGGLRQALWIILLANLISVLTSLSLAAVATNLKVRGGGDYYLISRTLGIEFGGAIGLVLFLAQSISIAFYCIGFAEVVVSFWDGSHLQVQLIALVAIGVLGILSWLGADWATRFQFIVMAVLVLALVSFFIGGALLWDSRQLQHNWLPSAQPLPFWSLFAVFFPAVTGFTQGVSMSGDLRDAGRSLPLGTFAAVGVSLVIYLAAALVFAAALPQSMLLGDYHAMSRVAWLPTLITLGVFAATLSSAMASFLGAPRILQSLAADKIFPLLSPLAITAGANNNPRRAVLLAGSLAVLSVGLGNLNLIASVVAMFFLISYGLLNYATYFEARAASPSFRPRFKWFHHRISLSGAVLCLLAMLAIDWKAGALAVAVLFILYHYLQRTIPHARWADSRRSYHLQQVREHLLQISHNLEHPRDWRPHFLVFSDDRRHRQHLLQFASWLEGHSGLTTLVQLLISPNEQHDHHKQQALQNLYEDIAASHTAAFPLVINAPDFAIGNSILLQAFGVGPLRANTILINRGGDHSAHYFSAISPAYGRNLRTALNLGYNLAIFDATEPEWRQLQAQAPNERRIDVWYEHDANGALMLLLAHLMTRHPLWEQAHLRILLPVTEADAQTAQAAMANELETIRIEAEICPMDCRESVCLFKTCEFSSLVFLPVKLRQGQLYGPFNTNVDQLLPHLPLVALILAAQDIQLDADPEEGGAALLAHAEDRFQLALQQLEQSEKEYQHARKQLDLHLADLMAADRQPALTQEERQNRHQMLEEAKSELDVASRRSARAEAELELATHQLEQLKKHHTPGSI